MNDDENDMKRESCETRETRVKRVKRVKHVETRGNTWKHVETRGNVKHSSHTHTPAPTVRRDTAARFRTPTRPSDPSVGYGSVQVVGGSFTPRSSRLHSTLFQRRLSPSMYDRVRPRVYRVLYEQTVSSSSMYDRVEHRAYTSRRKKRKKKKKKKRVERRPCPSGPFSDSPRARDASK